METIIANTAFVTSRRYCDPGEHILKRCCSSLLQLSRGMDEEQIGYSSKMMGIRFNSSFLKRFVVDIIVHKPD